MSIVLHQVLWYLYSRHLLECTNYVINVNYFLHLLKFNARRAEARFRLFRFKILNVQPGHRQVITIHISKQPNPTHQIKAFFHVLKRLIVTGVRKQDSVTASVTVRPPSRHPTFIENFHRHLMPSLNAKIVLR